MKNLCLMGGGRWSRVLMSVLNEVLSSEWQIHWITRHGFNAAQQWCQAHSSQRIDVFAELTEQLCEVTHAAIVANSPQNHATSVRRFLSLGVPTFCEKPLVLDAGLGLELENLAVQHNCPLGINLLITNASYLEDFRRLLCDTTIQHIEINWADPWSEERYGETKYCEASTPIIDDMFPHCWSVLRSLNASSGSNHWKAGCVSYRDNSDVCIELKQSSIDAVITLSRRSVKRVREVVINKGEALLDFSVEPGFVELRGKREVLAWTAARPLTRSLCSFVDIVQNPSGWQHWPLSVVQCRDSFVLATEFGAAMRQSQHALLRRMLSEPGAISRECQDRLLLDTFLPVAMQHGRRVNLADPTDTNRFLEQIEAQLDAAMSGSFHAIRW